MESPYRGATDSPSRQLLLELSRLSIDREQRHRDALDKHAETLEKEHRQSLAAADEKRRQLREHAVVVLERHELEARLAEEQRQRDEEVVLQKLRLEKAEREAAREKERADNEKATAVAQREAHEQRQRAEQARLDRQRQEEEAKVIAEREAREAEAAKAEAERKAKEAAISALKQRQESERSASVAAAQANITTTIAPPVAPTIVATEPTSLAPTATAREIPNLQQREAEHVRYLQIHQNLKKLRAYMKEQVEGNAQLKTTMSKGRRAIQKCVSQLVTTGGSIKKQISEILDVLKSALPFTHPQVPVTDYMLAPPAVPDPNGPGLLLYFFNILAKALLRQYLGEASTRPKAADPVGVLGSTLFANVELRWNGYSLIDILIAKFHFLCPIVFGIYGPENTAAGRQRLGWRAQPSTGVLSTQQQHFERMTGLGAGFASIALRNFDKAKAASGFPPHHFWRAMADIVNTPSNMVTETHLVVLKAMIENNEERILQLFGSMGKVALRHALVDFPARIQKDTMASKALVKLPGIWKKESQLYL